jgi:hypothetical protein
LIMFLQVGSTMAISFARAYSVYCLLMQTHSAFRFGCLESSLC